MFNVNNNVIYKRNVCKIKEIKNMHGIKYYVLVPLDDLSLTINVPITNSNLLRNIISRFDSEELINLIPSIEVIDTNEKKIENEYKILFNSGNLQDLIKIIKTTYLRNSNRIANNRKTCEMDMTYFNKAEKRLYNELSISLNKTYDDTKRYIYDKVEELIK